MNYVSHAVPIWPGDRVESRVCRGVEGEVLDTAYSNVEASYKIPRIDYLEALVRWDNEHLDDPSWVPYEQLILRG
jgi:hypothetical protein